MNTYPGNAIWIEAIWPILLFFGGALWYGGRYKGLTDSVRERLNELQNDQRLGEHAQQAASDRLDRLDLRLTATETNLTNQGRTLDRIEGKLDRLIEARPEVRR
jgi:chemotaxis regulatin CheY-phosphate phosphatase CheZ